MKPFWDNLFHDIDGGEPRETVASIAGERIREDLRDIEDAIRGLEPKTALKLIGELKEYV